MSPEFLLVKFAGGRLAVVRITHGPNGQVFVRLEIPRPNPRKEG